MGISVAADHTRVRSQMGLWGELNCVGGVYTQFANLHKIVNSLEAS